MKRVLSLLLAFMAVLVMLAGCNSGDAVTNTYKTLSIAGISYDATMKAAAEAYASGHISEAQKATLIKYGTAFHGSWQAAHTALKIYVATDKPEAETRDRLLALVARALSEWSTFSDCARDMGVLTEGVK